MPTLVDIDVWRGNNLPPTFWPWADGYLGTADCQLTVWVGDEELFSAVNGDGLTIDPYGRQFIWERTLDQSRVIPLGRIARYELEDRAGGEATLFYGAVVGLGGLNLDGTQAGAEGALDFSLSANSGQDLDGWI
ncbi:MAG TPA: hypothetical protein VNX29_05490 [Kaistia sp.]|nr:hypothetical protein [Kaistia sp.]